MMKSLKISLIYFLFIFSLTSKAEDIEVMHFISNVSTGGPELNVIVFNNSKIEKKIGIDLGTSLDIENKNACLPISADSTFDKKEHELSLLGLSNFAFENISFVTTIPSHGFAYGYNPMGWRHFKFPCSYSYYIQTENSQIITKTVTLDTPKPDRVLKNYDKKSYEIKFSVDRNLNSNNLLVTLLIKNTTKFWLQMFVAEKKLENCNMSFDFENQVRRGLDGSLMFIAPELYGVALTPLKMDESAKELPDCRLILTLKNDLKKGYIENISIPLKMNGSFDRNKGR